MMKTFKKIIFPVLISVTVLSSCKQKELDPEAYVAWVENPANGLNTTKEAGDFKFSLQYKPLSYVALLNLEKENTGKQQLLKTMEEMKDLQYFTLRINSKTGESEMLQTNLETTDEYFYRVEYFSFHLKKDLYLLDGNDSLPCVIAHFERSYGISPNNSFILAFPLSEKEKALKIKGEKDITDKVLVYNDQYLQTGQVKLKIEKNSFNHIPELKL